MTPGSPVRVPRTAQERPGAPGRCAATPEPLGARTGIFAACVPCGATWVGGQLAHCSGCHRTFDSVSLFDTHRVGYGAHGLCRDPADLLDTTGYRLAVLREGLWRTR